MVERTRPEQMNPNTTDDGSVAGALVRLDATAKLPAVDGSLLTGIVPTIPTANTVWVSKGGNNATGVRGREDKPYLTIQAAINAATAGDAVLVLPGDYSEQIVCKDDVSVVGLDRRRCALVYAGSVDGTVVVTMAQRILFSNFDLKLNPTAGLTVGVHFPADVSNGNAAVFRVNVNAGVSGNVTGCKDEGTGTAVSRATLRLSTMLGSGTGYGLHKTGAGTSDYLDCFLSGPTGVKIAAGTAKIDAGRIEGTTTGLRVDSGATVVLASNVSISAYDNQGTITQDAFGYPRNNLTATSDPATSDDKSKGYAQGSEWLNTTSGTAFKCYSAAAGAAVWKSYSSSGATVIANVLTPNVIDDSLTAPPGSPRENDAYFIAATHTGGWAGFTQGDLVVYTGATPPPGLTAATWTKVSSGTGGHPADGAQVIVTGLGQGTAAGSFIGQGKKVALYTTANGWQFSSPVAGQTAVVTGAGDPLEAAVCTYSGSLTAWTAAAAKPRFYTATATTTTLGTTDAVATGMTVTPSKGTYDVDFQSSGGNSGSGTNTMSIYAGVTQAPESPRQIQDGNNSRIGFACNALVTVDGTQAITGQWKVSASTGTMLQRTLKIRRVA